MSRTVNAKALAKLDEIDDWSTLYTKMVAYAARLANRKYKWKGGTELPKGNDIVDIVQTVVKKLFSGKRTWDPDKVPLEVWVRGNIRSEMNNLYSSAFTDEKRVREPLLEADDETLNYRHEEAIAHNGDVFTQAQPNPEHFLIKKEQAHEIVLTIEALYDAIEGDELLEKIYYEIAQTNERKRRVLAEKLGVSRQEITNALRRLDRHIERYRKERGGRDE